MKYGTSRRRHIKEDLAMQIITDIQSSAGRFLRPQTRQHDTASTYVVDDPAVVVCAVKQAFRDMWKRRSKLGASDEDEVPSIPKTKAKQIIQKTKGKKSSTPQQQHKQQISRRVSSSENTHSNSTTVGCQLNPVMPQMTTLKHIVPPLSIMDEMRAIEMEKQLILQQLYFQQQRNVLRQQQQQQQQHLYNNL